MSGPETRQESLAALRYLLVSVLMFGGVWPVTKHALQHATPLWFAFNRAGLAAVTVGLAMALLGRLRLPARADLPSIFGIGLLQLGLFFALTHLALLFVPVGRTTILANVTIFWLIPLSVWLLGERVSPRRWVAAGIGLLGALALMAPWTLLDLPRDAAGGLVLGYSLLLLASLSWTFAILATRRFPPTRPIMELLPWSFALGALLILPFALLREPAGGIGWEALPHALFVGGIAAPIGTWATTEAGRKLSGTLASLGFLLIPAFGVVLAAVWLGEPLGLDIWIGGALIVASVWLAAKG